MGTFAALQTALASDLRDGSNLSFNTTQIAAFIDEGVIEVGRIAPARFQEDVTVVADTLTYALQSGSYPDLEVHRVEVWDLSYTPDKFCWLLEPRSSGYSLATDAGWEVWDGTLRLPNGIEEQLVVGTHVIKVWGWRPYPLVSGSTEMPMTDELEWAVRAYAKMAAIESLLASRNVYTQWQTAGSATDATPASLHAQLSAARQDWERRSRQIARLRGGN